MNKEAKYFVKKQELDNNTNLSREDRLIQRTALFREHCTVPMLAEDPRGKQNPFFKELCSLMVDLTDAMWSVKDKNLPPDIIESLDKCNRTVKKMWDDSSIMRELLTRFEEVGM